MGGKQRSNSKNENNQSLLMKIAIGTAISVVLYFIFIALYAFVSLKTGASASVYMPVGIVLGVLAGLIGGFAAVRPVKQKGFVLGALTGLASAVICAAILFIVNGNKAGNGVFFLMAAIISGSAAGGISAVNLKIKKKY